MKKLYMSLIIFMTLFCLTSCEYKSQDKETAFLNLYYGIDFNKGINLVEDPLGANNGYLGSEIDLILQNQTPNKISFDLSKDVSIYTYSEKQQKWVQLVNKFTYKLGEELIYPEGTKDITNALVLVWPEIYDFNTPITIRVVVIGHRIVNDNKTIDLGAYYDSKLVPLK